MKKILKFLLLSQSVLLIGCGNDYKSKQMVYYIGETYYFDQDSIKVELDKENERFIFNYDTKDEKSDCLYEVVFNCNCYVHDSNCNDNDCDVTSSSSNSSEFKYLYENGEPIVFDEHGFLTIYKSTKLYTDYSSANSTIKEAISNDKFGISFGGETFIPQKHED